MCWCFQGYVMFIVACLIQADDLVVLLEVSTAIRIMTAVDVQCSVLDTATPDSEKLAFWTWNETSTTYSWLQSSLRVHSSRLLTSLRKEVLDPVYQEEALMMEQEQILPLVAQFQLAKGCFRPSGALCVHPHWCWTCLLYVWSELYAYTYVHMYV